MNPTGPAGDTSLDDRRRRFPQTSWSLVARLRDGGEQAGREALEALSRRYWRPVYQYVRIAWAKSNEDAKDLVQAFFLWLLEGDALADYRPDRGSFRTYLTALFDGFSRNQERAMQRLKRGGGARILSLDEELAAAESTPAPGEDPMKSFERAWRDEVMRHALARARERFRDTLGERQFRVFEEYALGGADDGPTYAVVAGRLGMKESDVRNHLFAVREAIREEIREELLQQAGDPDAFEEEWRAFLGE